MMKKEFRILIVGERDYSSNLRVLTDELDETISEIDTNIFDVSIITVGNTGSLLELYAEDKGFQIVKFGPSWSIDKLSDSKVRNEKMINYIKDVSDNKAILFMNNSNFNTTMQLVKLIEKEDIDVVKIQW